MTIYRTIEWINYTKPTMLDPRDTLEHTSGGIELTFHTSPATRTFFPYHKISNIQTIDTEKLPKALNADGSTDDDSIML